jgi:hypothetical protein
MSLDSRAKEVGCSTPTLTTWRRAGAPISDDAPLRDWLVSVGKRVPDALLRRINEAGEKEDPAAPKSDPAAWEEFLKQAGAKLDDNPKAALGELTRARGFASFMWERAAKAGNRSEVKFWADQLAKFEGVLHDAQLRAKKLGIDSGDLLPKAEVERIAWALAFWLMRSTDQHLDALTSKLSKLFPGAAPEDIRRALEPELLTDRWLVPFAKAAKIQAGTTVPDWLVSKMREATGDFIERGEAAFDAIK